MRDRERIVKCGARRRLSFPRSEAFPMPQFYALLSIGAHYLLFGNWLLALSFLQIIFYGPSQILAISCTTF